MKQKIAVLGGDERFLHLMALLAGQGRTVYAVGFAEAELAEGVLACGLEDLPVEELDALLLPVHGLDESGAVATYFPAGALRIPESVFARLPAGALVFSGTAGGNLRVLCRKYNRELVVLYEEEAVALLNAVPTAEGALHLAMDLSGRVIQGQRVLLAGFGKIGQAVARLFHQLGAQVTVMARSKRDLALAQSWGLASIHLEELDQVASEVQICLNTVPHLILTEERLRLFSKESLLLDLASKPGGMDFQAAKRLGLRAFHALGLPGERSPITAGEILAQPILERLQERV